MSCPWKNGFYTNTSMMSRLLHVKGEACTSESLSGNPSWDDSSRNGTLKYGDFGKAHPEVIEKTGIENYNVEMAFMGGMFKIPAVVNKEGTTFTYYGFTKNVEQRVWKTDEEISALKESGESAEAPNCHYKIQPENQGKLLFISGAPSLGKSTSGHLLSKNHGYVFYEADCFSSNLNPYIPPDVENVPAGVKKQRFLTGVAQERIDAIAAMGNEFRSMMKGGPYNFEKIARFYSAMCKDIIKERKRIGGDWVVSQGVMSRAFRDHFRAELGPEVVFVVLNMAKEDQQQRLQERYGDSKMALDALKNFYDYYEVVAADEPNAIEVLVTKDMSRDDVVEQILNMVAKYEGQQS